MSSFVEILGKMKVLIVDDSPLFLIGFRMTLTASYAFQNILEAGNAEKALSLLESDPEIGVAVVDVQLSGDSDGLDLVKEIGEKYPKVATMILSHYKKPNYIYRAIRYGARAYMAKDSTPEAIMKAVLDVSAGNCIFFGDTIPRATLMALFGKTEKLETRTPYSLSTNELSVLQKITSGMNNNEIAAALDIAPSTVETYKDRLKTKFGFKSIVECVAFAVSKGIVYIKE